MDSEVLAQRFVDRRGPCTAEGLAAILEQLVMRGREAWPDFKIEPGQFVDHLADRLGQHEDEVVALMELRVTDLYLACACSHGDELAMRAFNTQHEKSLRQRVTKLGLAASAADEVAQQVIEYLLMPRGERPAPIALYTGHGDLRSYLNVAATREALRLAKKSRKQAQQHTDDFFNVVSAEDDPELANLKKTYRGQFKRAFQEALGSLASAERNLLRYHYVDNLTTREMGAIIGGSSSTVTRRLANVRSKLLVETRHALIRQLKLGRGEFESVMRMIESQLDVSLARFLDKKTTGKP